MKNISDTQYRAVRIQAAEAPSLIEIIRRPRPTENETHAFRGVKKCDPPHPTQSQELNKLAASSHRITANV